MAKGFSRRTKGLGGTGRNGTLETVYEQEVAASWSATGDSRAAFEAFVKTHMKRAYAIALGLVGNHEDALELSQEAFAKAYQNMETLNAKGKLFPWFYQILRNLCFSHLRKKRYRRTSSIHGTEENPIELAAPTENDPERNLEQDEQKDLLWKAINQLDEKHREVIVLRHFQNLSYEQMAQMLFCSKGTVTSRLYYARQRLKEILVPTKGGQA
jgi:RNA polymerase sigma-70 factor (ECF subfamily)